MLFWRDRKTHFELHMSGMIQIIISILDILFVSHIRPMQYRWIIGVRAMEIKRNRSNRHTSNSNTKIISSPLVIPSGLFCFPHLKLVISGLPVFSLTHFSARASNAEIKVDWAERSADDLIPTSCVRFGLVWEVGAHQCGWLSLLMYVRAVNGRLIDNRAVEQSGDQA
jgi:hypothetical protein